MPRPKSLNATRKIRSSAKRWRWARPTGLQWPKRHRRLSLLRRERGEIPSRGSRRRGREEEFHPLFAHRPHPGCDVMELSLSRPILHFQPPHPSEFVLMVGDQRQPRSQSVCRDPEIVGADQLAPALEFGRASRKPLRLSQQGEGEVPGEQILGRSRGTPGGAPSDSRRITILRT